MPKFYAMLERCRQDGICASVCPVHVIRGPKGQTPVMRKGKETDCIACGHCMAFCPHGAARVDVLPVEDLRPLDRSRLPDAEALGMLFKSRRSIRHFQKNSVPRDVLELILSETRHAPSGKNRRPVRWVVVHEEERLREVGECMASWLESLVAGAEDNGALRQAEARALLKAWRMGLDPLFRGAPHLVLAVTPKSWPLATVDAAIALTYLELAALARKVGACWAGYVTIAAQGHAPLRHFLGIGEEEQASGGQMLGFTGLRPTASAPRNPLPVYWL